MSTVNSTQSDADGLGPPVLPALWRAKWAILSVAFLAALLGFGVSALQPVTYQTEARLLLVDPRNSGVFRDTGATFIDPTRYVRNQAEFASSTTVLQRASELLDGRLSARELEDDHVTVRPSIDLDLLTISATDGTAVGAMEIANAVAEAYEDVVRQQVASNAEESLSELSNQRAQLQESIASLEEVLERDPTDLTAIAERDAAISQLVEVTSRADQITVDAALFGSGVDLFERAEAPRTPAAPKPARNAALAFVLGALAVSGVAWWRADETATVDDRNDPAPILRAPLLARIPDFEESGSDSSVPTLTMPGSTLSEAFHFLVGGLAYALEESGGRAVVITSAQPNDGKTSVALNLAVAASQDGREVLLVDADTRVRGLTRSLDLDPTMGLERLANDDVAVSDVVHLVELENRSLPVIPAREIHGDHAGFFRTSRFREAIRGLGDLADLVLIDTPPLMLASDASAIASHVDGIIVVVSRGTSVKVLEQTRERLSLIGVPTLGYVFTKDRPLLDEYRYAYGYGSEVVAGPAGRRARRREPDARVPVVKTGEATDDATKDDEDEASRRAGAES